MPGFPTATANLPGLYFGSVWRERGLGKTSEKKKRNVKLRGVNTRIRGPGMGSWHFGNWTLRRERDRENRSLSGWMMILH